MRVPVLSDGRHRVEQKINTDPTSGEKPVENRRERTGVVPNSPGGATVNSQGLAPFGINPPPDLVVFEILREFESFLDHGA
jgi:hypothetical protein